MSAATGVVRVHGSAGAVFARLADPGRWRDWSTIHAGWAGDPPAGLAAGTTFRSRLVLMGIHDTLSWTVTANESPARLVLDGKGTIGFRGRIGYALHTDEADEGATAVTYSVETSTVGPAIGPLKALKAGGTNLLALDIDHSLRRLDALLAGRDVAGVAPPTPDATAAAAGPNMAPLLRLAGRLVRAR